MNDKIYTPQELAERWSCNPHTVYNLINAGELKTFRVGRQIRVTAEEVRRYEGGGA